MDNEGVIRGGKWLNEWRLKFKDAWKSDEKEKFYILDMFAYPSGAGLHLGHTRQTACTDLIARMKIMQGFDVLHPNGFDSFGLPAENYAIKTGIHPRVSTENAINNFIKQHDILESAYDFADTVQTHRKEYYRWTQKIFGKLFEAGIIYKSYEVANWCESCKTVIANEQVEGGACERCGSEVVQKGVPAWFAKITDFADDLLNDLEDLDWPESTKKIQRDWIGKKEGHVVRFGLMSGDGNSLGEVEVFTTRLDTLPGVTFVAVAPDGGAFEMIREKVGDLGEEVARYAEESLKKRERDRLESKEKTGVVIDDVVAVNPLTGESVQVFVADYVLGGYGSGAVMGVPAHDKRDFDFAKKFGLNIVRVIGCDICSELESACPHRGEIIAGRFKGLSSEDAITETEKFLSEKVEKRTTYRLRDWSLSRQRYWGAPIPIVYDGKSNPHFVGEGNLPWLLPEDVDLANMNIDGAPLELSDELRDRVKKVFGEDYVPEYETMDTFVDSSWYFLRYVSPEYDSDIADAESVKRWMPVDLYVGGQEHAYMHLLYARFMVKAMNKIGLLPGNFAEPFYKLRHQGYVLDANGKKMSKSKGNTISPDEVAKKYGADALKVYMLFAGPFNEAFAWKDDGVKGVKRFLDRFVRLSEKITDEEVPEFKKELHKTIKKVSDDIDSFKFNTAVASMMELVNFAYKIDVVNKNDYFDFVKILSVFAPAVAEYVREVLGFGGIMMDYGWPKYDESVIGKDSVVVVVQVKGKVKGDFEITTDASDDEIVNSAKSEFGDDLLGENYKIVRTKNGRIILSIF